MTDTSILRFAPSPTGRLHVGNARVALINWLQARADGGRLLLRLDDTDAERSTEDHARAIERDLAWLGLDWDLFARQSDRLEVYDAAADRLRAAGRLYPCYETAEELELKRRAALAAGRPPIYDRAALALSDTDRAALEAEGRRPHWRFRLVPGAIAWTDRVRGDVRFEADNLSDPVLIRADGRPLYTLTSVVDDAAFDITLIVRGEDHVANTAVQAQIFQALDAAVPAFAHLPLLTDAGGQGLSKRLGSLSLERLRADGIEALTLAAYLARLGTPDPIAPIAGLEELVAGFDLGRFGRATPKFDPAELAPLNAKVLHGLAFGQVADRLPAGFDEILWLAVRGNLARLEDAAAWLEICRGSITPRIENPDLLAAAAECLPAEPWTVATWSDDAWRAWTGAIKVATGCKGRALFHPLRLALTGREDGPELKALLPLMGAARVRARLRGEAG